MKSAPFDYVRATTVAEATEALSGGDPLVRLMAGGQSLMPLLATRGIRPHTVLDVRRIRELDYVERSEDTVAVGALTRHVTVETSPVVATYLPLLAAAIRRVAYPTVRNQGTAGGSLAHADPRAEYPAVALALDATIVLRAKSGERTVSAADFFHGGHQTDLRPDELLTEIRFPIPAPGWRWDLDEFTPRYRDFAIVAVYAGIRLAPDGTVEDARVVVGATDPAPRRLVDVERQLIGQPATAAVAVAAGAAAATQVSPEPDRFGSADYKRHLTATLTARTLTRLFDAQEATA